MLKHLQFLQIVLASPCCMTWWTIFLFFSIFWKNFFQNCPSKKSEPDISPILDFSSGVGKSDMQKLNLKVFLRFNEFFYIFKIFYVLKKKPQGRLSLNRESDNDP